MTTPYANLTQSPAQARTVPRRPAWLINLHWITVLALFAALGLILLRDDLAGKALRTLLLEWHRWLGLTVLAATVIRVALRALHGPLPELASGPRLLSRGAHAIHGVLYLGLLGLPLLGWALTSARGHHMAIGPLPIPALCGADPDLADRLEDLHRWTAWTVMSLVGIHAAAALWHHFIRRDAVLRAMWPWARAPR